MVGKRRNPGTGRKAVAEPAETAPNYGSCKACNSSLVKLLIDSRAIVPQYAIVCNNKDCPQYRVIVRE